MGVIITRKPWTRQPQGQVAANIHSQFSPRLRVLTCGPGLANLAGPSITKNAITSGARGDFTASIFDGSTSYGTHDLSDLSITGGGQGVTVLCRFVVDSLGGYRSISDIKDNNAGLFLRVNQSTGNLELDKNGQYALFNYSAGITVGKVYTVCLSFVSSGNYACYLNGVQIASGSGDTTIGGTLQTLYIGRDSTASHYFSGGFGLFGFWTRALSGPEAIELSRNPWQLLEPAQERIWVPSAGGGGGTVALTGSAVTASAGTLTPSTSIPLSGQAATASAGTIAPAISAPISGQAATASAGTLTPLVSAALSGQAATASAGTVSPTVTIALTGTAVTASAGTVTYSAGNNISLTLTGAEVTASAGSLGLSSTVPVSGSAAAASSGTLTPGTSVAVSGTAVTASAGTLTYSANQDLTLALTGEAVQVSAGTITVIGGVSAVAVTSGAPGPRQQRWVVYINGKRYIGSLQEIEQIVAEFAEEQAEKAQTAKPQKKPKIKVEPGRPVGVKPSETVKVQPEPEVQQQVRNIYAEAYARAIAQMELDEEEDIISLL